MSPEPAAHGLDNGPTELELNVSQSPNYTLTGHAPLFGPDQSTSSLVDEFFRVLYPVPSFSFLHPRTTRERLAEGSLDEGALDEALVFAICGATTSQRYT
ncbi:hypothetical protein CLCR_03206 [Cladophialophora carrionii]|uniref:Uncharacterized protein n=1 Tax=Cladophialophora carrionii TaxID=86049 RepID=A0A1C1D2H9_9EURO|nr:hypothetical protein CLCR_03206 [Cladophialophora carrionii]